MIIKSDPIGAAIFVFMTISFAIGFAWFVYLRNHNNNRHERRYPIHHISPDEVILNTLITSTIFWVAIVFVFAYNHDRLVMMLQTL